MDQNITVFFEAMTTIQWPIPVTTFSVITWHVQPLFQSNEVLSPWWWLLSTAAITWWSEAPLPMSLLTCAVAPCHHSHKPGTKLLPKCWNLKMQILTFSDTKPHPWQWRPPPARRHSPSSPTGPLCNCKGNHFKCIYDVIRFSNCLQKTSSR